MGKIFYYAPLEKVLQLSVGRPSVAPISFDPFSWSIPNLVQGLSSMSRWSLLIFRSHVQRSMWNHSSQPSVMSAKYLLTPSLDHYQTWCRGCPQWVDDYYWFSGHMFKGQCETTLLSPLWCPLNIFWPLHLVIPNLVQGFSSMSRWSLLIFRSHVQKSILNHSFEPMVLSTQYLLIPSLDQYQCWCRDCAKWKDDPYWFSGHMFKGQGQTTLLSPVCCPLYIF